MSYGPVKQKKDSEYVRKGAAEVAPKGDDPKEDDALPKKRKQSKHLEMVRQKLGC